MSLLRIALLTAVFAISASSAVAGDGAFDLKIDVNLAGELSEALQPGDVLQFTLQPAKQYGVRDAVGDPFVLQKSWAPGALIETVRFRQAMHADTIYTLEMQVIRPGQREATVTYVSALHRTQQMRLDEGIKLRMFQANEWDGRTNHVMVTMGDDGVYRLTMFFA